MPELLEGNPVGESLPANPDALQHSIAAQLVQNQRSIDLPSAFLMIGDDAAHKVGVRVPQGDHQIGQLFLVQVGDGPEHTLGPAQVLSVLPQILNKRVLGILEEGDDVLVLRVHVLHQPLVGRIVDFTGIMDDGEIGYATEIALAEFRMFGMGADQLVDEGFVRGTREQTLLVQERHYTHRFVDEVDRRLEIETEIDEFPFDSFALVFFLLQDEHGVVEQLLQLLVGVVDAQLLERVQLEDLEAGYVENTDETGALSFRSAQRPIDSGHQPSEHSLVASFGYGFDGKFDLAKEIKCSRKTRSENCHFVT